MWKQFYLPALALLLGLAVQSPLLAQDGGSQGKAPLAPVVMTPIATHVDYWVQDLESALDFYTKDLGWELEFIEQGEYAMLSVDGHFRLGLITAASRLPDWQPGDSLPPPSLCLMTVDMHAEEQRLAAKGIRLQDVSADSQVIVKSFRDSAGNSFTLYQPNLNFDALVSNEQPDPEAVPPTSFSGRVVDLDAQPLAGCTLVVLNPETGSVLARFESGSDGSFSGELSTGGALELRIFDSEGNELFHSHEALSLSTGESHSFEIVAGSNL